MGGSYWEEGIFFEKRKMHITATLGFHAPFAVPHGANMFSPEHIKAAYAAGLKSVARMLQLGANGRGGEGVIPNRLILELLDKGPNEVYLINTVLRAKELRIDLIGFLPVEWNARAACNACMNRNNGAHVTMACSNPMAAPPTRIRKNVDQVMFEGFGGEGAYACVVLFERDKNGRLIDVTIAPTVTDDDLPLKPAMLSRLNQDDGLAPSMRIGRTGLPQ